MVMVRQQLIGALVSALVALPLALALLLAWGKGRN